MKTKFLLLSLCLLGSMVFTSCKKNYPISQRDYDGKVEVVDFTNYIIPDDIPKEQKDYLKRNISEAKVLVVKTLDTETPTYHHISSWGSFRGPSQGYILSAKKGQQFHLSVIYHGNDRYGEVYTFKPLQ